EQASKRIEREGWSNVETVHDDATKFTPPEGQADVVTFSYSLTMIPDWFAAIQNAYRILKPGGVIGVVDFYISRKYPAEGLKRHGWLSRTFWPTWYALDNVFVGAEHVPYLHHLFEPIKTVEAKGPIPVVPLLRTPYYWFLGRKKDS
ncbi:MAG: class I SAM-dependent methyltransferase, partial [Planctomycetia bacterium]